MNSEAWGKVQMMITKQIQAMGGRSDKLFIGGCGMGGTIALLQAFYSPDVLGGVFAADCEVPANILQDVTGVKPDASIPQFEAKLNMFVGITQAKDTSSQLKTKIGQ